MNGECYWASILSTMTTNGNKSNMRIKEKTRLKSYKSHIDVIGGFSEIPHREYNAQVASQRSAATTMSSAASFLRGDKFTSQNSLMGNF